MYKMGDVVVYGTDGLCKIDDITEKKFDGEVIKYYILSPLKRPGETVYVPCKNEKIMERMRAVLSVEQARRLIEDTKIDALAWIDNERARQRVYKEILLCGSSEDIVAMTQNLHVHREKQEKQGKKLHASDEKFLRDAEKMLFEELAYIFDVSLKEVRDMVRKGKIK